MAMNKFNYRAAAEFYPTRKHPPRRQSFGSIRFDETAEAIRLAWTTYPPPEPLLDAILELDEQRYGSDEIRREYPLTRKAT